jgi:threonine synthase
VDAVQAEGCAPLVDAFASGKEHAELCANPQTYANGLRVPGTIGDHLILKALREWGGTAVSVSDEAMEGARLALAQKEGLFVAPEAAATLAAAEQLVETKWLAPDDEVVLLLTGEGFKYPLRESES